MAQEWTKWRLSDARVIGGALPLDAEVPFAQARVVLQKQAVSGEAVEEYLIVNRYSLPNYAEGNTMTREEWRALIDAGEAHELEASFPARANGTLWLLGPDFPKRDSVIKELRAAKALTDAPEYQASFIVCLIDENLADQLRKRLAHEALKQALRTQRKGQWEQALPHAERAFDLDGLSGERAEERVALLALLYQRLGRKQRSDGYLQMALNSRGQEFYERTRKKFLDLSMKPVPPMRPPRRPPALPKLKPFRQRLSIASLVIFFSTIALVTALVVLGWWTFPSVSDFPKVNDSDLVRVSDLLRKLTATILVYFMQFGFIAFECGVVRQSYRRQSAVKNLVVFAISFISYMIVGWRIQRNLNGLELTSLLDVAFNAGFASTVALIVANTITERGTLLVNSLCSMVAAGIAYPFLAGLAFEGGYLYNSGFRDTAGGCVVHVLGGMFGLAAALWIGPRAKRRFWYLLGKPQVAELKDNMPLSVIGAFFLWFGWLGFNSGNAKDWSDFLVALTNTNIAAAAGGLVGLIIAVANMGMLTTTASSDLSRKSIHREIANLDRIVLGMMGGLVAVTANASLIKPWQAFVEGMIGASVAVLVSAVMVVYLQQHLDDPLGAIATHGLAGTAGVLLTAWFRPDLCTIGAQAWGCGVAALLGWSLASVPCAILLGVERLRVGSEWWLYGRLWRLTPYEQQHGATGTEFWVPNEATERARQRILEDPPVVQLGREDKGWIDAVAVLALSDRKTGHLIVVLNQLLDENYQGSAEEQIALAAIGARANVASLPMCVKRISKHLSAKPAENVTEWKTLTRVYTETLILTTTQLAESFAAQYRLLRLEQPSNLEEMIEGFVKACDLLKQIGEEELAASIGLPPWYAKLRSRAIKNFYYLQKLPWYEEIIEMYRMNYTLTSQNPDPTET
jgi:Amt family ammonium transporter